MKRLRSLYAATVFAVALFLYASPGDSGPPMLAAAELPPSISADCGPQLCAHEPDYTVHWLGKTPAGHLFLVLPARCEDGSPCRSWLVEKTRQGVVALLDVEGRYRLVRSEGAHPEVQIRKDVTATQIAYSRFVWRDGAYVQAEVKDLYRVDGRECGTREDCNTAAVAALRRHRVGQALKIWETVHRVSWI